MMTKKMRVAGFVLSLRERNQPRLTPRADLSNVIKGIKT